MNISNLKNMLRCAVFIGKHFILYRIQQMLPAVACGGSVHILLKLPVKAGQAAVTRPPRNHIDRLVVQVDQVAGLPDAVVLDILQRADPHHLPEQSAEMTLTDTASGGKFLYGNGFRIVLINIGKSRSDVKMSAGQILRRTVLLIRHKCQAIHLRTERHQQTMYHPLIHGSFFMEFLKDPGNKEMQHRILLSPDDDRQFLRNIEKLPEHITSMTILLQKQPRLHIQIFADTRLGVVDHNVGNLGKNNAVVAATIWIIVRFPTINSPRAAQTASDLYSI